MQRGLERHWGKARAQQALGTLARSGPHERWCGPGAGRDAGRVVQCLPVRQAAATQATYLTRFRLCVSATRNAAGSPQRHGGAALPDCGGLRLGAGTAAGWPMVAAAHGLLPTIRGRRGSKVSTPHVHHRPLAMACGIS